MQIKKQCESTAFTMAERQGFEPWVRDNRTHDFQSCSFSRSDTSPCILLCNRYLYSIEKVRFMSSKKIVELLHIYKAFKK